MQGSAPVKYIVGILTADMSLRNEILAILSNKVGEIDYISDWYLFPDTNVYIPEMGRGLRRSFVSIKDLNPPEDLSRLKAITTRIEDKYMVGGKRTVNLDPGYIDHFKIVLASGKFSTQSIALTKGCYAEFLMYYEKGHFQPLPWCYPDFAKKTYEKDMLIIRRLFKGERRFTDD